MCHGDTSSLPEVITIEEPRPATLFALIIGIDVYKDCKIRNLLGAVKDALTVKEFLISKFGISEHRIVVLLDKEATRKNILKALRRLALNRAISNRDPILVYFAGHGSEVQPPIFNWPTSNSNRKIQMLLPHDFVSEGTRHDQGQGIFDITLSQILSDIATNKSDNITVIFDCCHSGSGTRKSSSDETIAVRGIELPLDYTIPVDHFDSAVQNGSVRKIGDLSSHVLLAACKQDQSAVERKGYGAFTRALLRLLEQEGVDKLTYKDVIMRMPTIPMQDPQCEGVNQNRILFDSKVHGRHLDMIRIRPHDQSEYILDAGEALGVALGAEFTLYPDNRISTSLGSVVVTHTTPFKSVCSQLSGALPSLLQATYAVQTRIGARQDLRLFIDPGDEFFGLYLDLLKQLGQEMELLHADPLKRFFRLVDTIDELPDLVIGTRGGLVQFEVTDPICRHYGLAHMPYLDVRVGDQESDYLMCILRSAADFYRHLHHSRTKEPSLTQRVDVECLELERSKKLNKDLNSVYVPKRGCHNLIIDKTITISVHEEKIYGFKIINKSNDPLYVALFYFDVSDLSIVTYYLPATAADDKVDFPLPANRSLTIGFGDGGWLPRTYFLRENQKVDVGFLRLYLSTNYVDYSGIAQQTPFLAGGRGDQPVVSETRRNLWDALTIPIIQQ
ncbi:hypothetical protein DXG01_014761 [Tephrocybe rancida]|nr:hypothetical protein DXG01_014761 [Tephrocybe rancida]